MLRRLLTHSPGRLGGVLLVAGGLGVAIVLIAATAAAQTFDINSPGTSEPISSAELRNYSYPNDFARDGRADLANGIDSEPVAPDAAGAVTIEFQRAALGTIDERPAATVVLATNAGGSGTFHDLHVVMRSSAGVLEHTAIRSLGDRIRLQGLVFQGKDIRVDFTGFADEDPMCCPSLNVAQVLRLEGRQLVMVRGEQAPALLSVPEGLSMFGWFGGPTSSTAILNASARLATLWHFVADEGTWLTDSRQLPDSIRQTIAVNRGTGLWVSAQTATQIPVPLMPVPSACPLNPGPSNPVDPSMIVHVPGNGEHFRGSVPVVGLARVFEGTVSIRVLVADGSILAETFTTAEVGGPWFGAFTSEVAVSVTEPTAACVQVFEQSAVDGSLLNVVQIGVTLRPVAEGS